ncbi:HD domain-containing phosphohydrolase [uncultured Thiothrix sp.]|uniref:HD-GYP domain-containing protein n=1 Tax=uncultured Thiothrix sp. TaxID=223185 RepID=UPI002624C624|nr:HD domain-containing phosphohydrolase [uncultured Thiothrix sp.]
MNRFLSSICRNINLTAFTRDASGQFKPCSDMPDWLVFFLVKQGDTGSYNLAEIFPYLSCFMEDAEQHWQAKRSEPLSSGIWIEIDELERELPLEASIMYLEGQEVLLLQQLGEKYTQDLSRLQQVRNSLLTQEMLESEVQRRTLEIRKREEEIAIKLVSLTSLRDEETGAHVRRIGLYAAVMAKALGWNAEEIDTIRVAAPMHDIGKIGIPDRILRKTGVLNDEEFNVMKKHTEIGASMLRGTKIPILNMAADIALNHHERWDGSGYPQGLLGEKIPISARITTIVDIYDALVHERVYKMAMPEEEALSLMQEMAGRHLDPHLMKMFLSLLPAMRRIRLEVTEESEEPSEEESLEAVCA